MKHDYARKKLTSLLKDLDSYNAGEFERQMLRIVEGSTGLNVTDLEKDKTRLDWLADVENLTGNIQLPTISVLRNPYCLRAAIDDAMEISRGDKK